MASKGGTRSLSAPKKKGKYRVRVGGQNDTLDAPFKVKKGKKRRGG